MTASNSIDLAMPSSASKQKSAENAKDDDDNGDESGPTRGTVGELHRGVAVAAHVHAVIEPWRCRRQFKNIDMRIRPGYTMPFYSRKRKSTFNSATLRRIDAQMDEEE